MDDEYVNCAGLSGWPLDNHLVLAFRPRVLLSSGLSGLDRTSQIYESIFQKNEENNIMYFI